MAASCRSALGGASHDEAYGMLAAMAERATRQRGRSPRSVLTGPASRGKRPSGRRDVDPRAGLCVPPSSSRAARRPSSDAELSALASFEVRTGYARGGHFRHA
jgi:hypothetical protein